MEWIKIFSDEDQAKSKLVANKPQLIIVNGERICLVWSGENFYAVQDACTHNRESLSKGAVNYMGEIICPLHHYRFNLQSGRACDSSCVDLKTYPLKKNDSGFFIGI